MVTQQRRNSSLKSWFLLTRPYSWINVVMVVILTLAFTKGVTFDSYLVVSIIVGLLFWNSGVFLHDYLNKDVIGRRTGFPSLSLILPLAILVIILALTAPEAILILLVSLVTVFLYNLKSKKLRISYLLFLFRPFTEIGIIYSVALIEKISIFNPNLLTLSIIVYLIFVSRNIIGDVRDYENDKYTLPKSFGRNITYLASSVFLIVLIYINQINYSIIPLLFILVLIYLRVNAYGLHKLYVLCTTFYFSMLLLQLNVNAIFVMVLLFIGFVLYNTYSIIPRKSNKYRPDWV